MIVTRKSEEATVERRRRKEWFWGEEKGFT